MGRTRPARTCSRRAATGRRSKRRRRGRTRSSCGSRIDEGAKYAVEKITFDGNASVSNETLRDLIVTREKGLPVIRNGYLVDDDLERDADAILAYYQTRGWIAAKVERPAVTDDPKPDRLDVAFRIAEGPRTFVASRDVHGAEHLTPAEVDAARVDPGRRAVQSERRASGRVRPDDALLEHGLARGVGQDHWTLSADKTKVDVVFTVDEGVRTFFGKTIIRGNAVTETSRIERQVAWKEGRSLLRGEDRRHPAQPRPDGRLPFDRDPAAAGRPRQPGAHRRHRAVRGAAALAAVRRRLPVRSGRDGPERPVRHGRRHVPQSVRPDAVRQLRGAVRADLAARLRRRELPRAVPLQLRLPADGRGLREPRADPGRGHRSPRRLHRVGRPVRLASGRTCGIRTSTSSPRTRRTSPRSRSRSTRCPRSRSSSPRSARAFSTIAGTTCSTRTRATTCPWPAVTRSRSSRRRAQYGKVSGQAASFWSVLGGVLAASFRAGGIYGKLQTGSDRGEVLRRRLLVGARLRHEPRGHSGDPRSGWQHQQRANLTVDYNTQATLPAAQTPGAEPCATLYPVQAQRIPSCRSTTAARSRESSAATASWRWGSSTGFRSPAISASRSSTISPRSGRTPAAINFNIGGSLRIEPVRRPRDSLHDADRPAPPRGRPAGRAADHPFSDHAERLPDGKTPCDNSPNAPADTACVSRPGREAPPRRSSRRPAVFLSIGYPF